MRKRNRVLLAPLWPVLLTASCAFPGRLLRGYAEGHPVRLSEALAENAALDNPVIAGMARFLFDDMGSLNTDGLTTYTLPWKVVATSMVLRGHETDGLPISPTTLYGILASYGFIAPSEIANWTGRRPAATGPVGLLRATASRGFPRVELEVASLGCAACHAGLLYDADGRPTQTMWLGAPNTSLNTEAYVTAVFAGLRHIQGREDRFWEALATLFPETSQAERNTIRKHVLPPIRDLFENDWRDRESAVPYSNGSAGLTNGVASVKNMLGLLDDDARATEVAFTSIPFIGDRVLRTSLLYDGTYGVPGRPRFSPMDLSGVSEMHLDAVADIVTFFVVPTLGIPADRARNAYSRVRQVVDFIATLRPPPFPGPIDTLLALEGERIYGTHCAECHGEFSPGLKSVTLVAFPNQLVPQERIRTDPHRWQLATVELAEAVASSDYRRYITVQTTGGYVAMPLSGLWISAPYLHNGSVPTLWHLMHPEQRPERFMVGGHMLDYDRVGIAGQIDETGLYDYPARYTPWSSAALYDTREPGKSRFGHEAEFAPLTEAQKRALLEYLKVL